MTAQSGDPAALLEEEKRCRAAVSAAPDSSPALAALADVLMRLGHMDEAEACTRQCIRQNPDVADFHYALGCIYTQRGSLHAAAPSFQAALDRQPDHARAAHKLGAIAAHKGETARAAALFGRALEIDPGLVQARALLMELLVKQQRTDDALKLGVAGVAWMESQDTLPLADYCDFLAEFAQTYLLKKDTAGARDCYLKILAKRPDDQATLHLLAAVDGRLTYDHARRYAAEEFDRYAAIFDQRLLKDLSYRAPEVMTADLRKLRPAADAFPRLLDLGCGTGLMAAALSVHYRLAHAAGVDLSKNMLAEAAKKGLYSELIRGDLAEVMARRTDAFSLITAADVFIYVGELAAIFEQAARLLEPGGIFAFSVEAAARDDIELSAAGRYRHSEDYIFQTSFAHNFDLLRIVPSVIRREVGEDVKGFYVYLTKGEDDA